MTSENLKLIAMQYDASMADRHDEALGKLWLDINRLALKLRGDDPLEMFSALDTAQRAADEYWVLAREHAGLVHLTDSLVPKAAPAARQRPGARPTTSKRGQDVNSAQPPTGVDDANRT